MEVTAATRQVVAQTMATALQQRGSFTSREVCQVWTFLFNLMQNMPRVNPLPYQEVLVPVLARLLSEHGTAKKKS